MQMVFHWCASLSAAPEEILLEKLYRIVHTGEVFRLREALNEL